jgi:hypothetical protein
MEWIGTKWFFDHRNEQISIEQLGIPLLTFSDAVYGIGKKTSNVPKSDAIPLDHFGYTTNSTLAEVYKDDTYLIITQLGRLYYPGLYPDYKAYWRFNQNDFDRLIVDSTVMKIYNNGELDVWKT